MNLKKRLEQLERKNAESAAPVTKTWYEFRAETISLLADWVRVPAELRGAADNLNAESRDELRAWLRANVPPQAAKSPWVFHSTNAGEFVTGLWRGTVKIADVDANNAWQVAFSFIFIEWLAAQEPEVQMSWIDAQRSADPAAPLANDDDLQKSLLAALRAAVK